MVDHHDHNHPALACNKCGAELGEAVATPCRHLFCLTCAAAQADTDGQCIICNYPLSRASCARVDAGNPPPPPHLGLTLVGSGTPAAALAAAAAAVEFHAEQARLGADATIKAVKAEAASQARALHAAAVEKLEKLHGSAVRARGRAAAAVAARDAALAEVDELRAKYGAKATQARRLREGVMAAMRAGEALRSRLQAAGGEPGPPLRAVVHAALQNGAAAAAATAGPGGLAGPAAATAGPLRSAHLLAGPQQPQHHHHHHRGGGLPPTPPREQGRGGSGGVTALLELSPARPHSGQHGHHRHGRAQPPAQPQHAPPPLSYAYPPPQQRQHPHHGDGTWAGPPGAAPAFKRARPAASAGTEVSALPPPPSAVMDRGGGARRGRQRGQEHTHGGGAPYGGGHGGGGCRGSSRGA